MNHTSFVIGRFQPFHKGHKALIKKALSVSKRVIVFIGSSQENRTEKNPFRPCERMKMILTSFDVKEQRRLVFVPLPDYADNADWLDHITSSLQLINQDEGTFTFVCCDKDLETLHNNKLVSDLLNVDTYSAHPPYEVDATSIRKDLKEGKLLSDIEGLNTETFNLLGEYRKRVPSYNGQ